MGQYCFSSPGTTKESLKVLTFLSAFNAAKVDYECCLFTTEYKCDGDQGQKE